jgi:hypothetical protein
MLNAWKWLAEVNFLMFYHISYSQSANCNISAKFSNIWIGLLNRRRGGNPYIFKSISARILIFYQIYKFWACLFKSVILIKTKIVQRQFLKKWIKNNHDQTPTLPSKPKIAYSNFILKTSAAYFRGLVFGG